MKEVDEFYHKHSTLIIMYAKHWVMKLTGNVTLFTPKSTDRYGEMAHPT